MPARKRKSSPRPSERPGKRANRDRPPAEEGQTNGETGANILRQEAERNWAASDRRAASRRRRKDAKSKQ